MAQRVGESAAAEDYVARMRAFTEAEQGKAGGAAQDTAIAARAEVDVWVRVGEARGITKLVAKDPRTGAL